MKGEENLTVPETCRSEAAIDEGAKIAVRWKRARERRRRNPDKKKKKQKKKQRPDGLFPSLLPHLAVHRSRLLPSRLSLTLLPKGQITPHPPPSSSDLYTHTVGINYRYCQLDTRDYTPVCSITQMSQVLFPLPYHVNFI
jgi:hypothetical protein